MSNTFQKWGYNPDGTSQIFTVAYDAPDLPEGWFESPDEANGKPSEATLRKEQEEARKEELNKANEIIAELQSQLKDAREQITKLREPKAQAGKAKGSK